MAKRANESDAPLTMAKRLKRVERKLGHQKPEMKHATFNVSGTVTTGTATVGGLTTISQGDTINSRSADRIKVWRIEIRGTTSVELDHYLLQAHGDAAPVVGDFNTSVGAFIVDSSLNTRFTEWKHYRNLYATGSADAMKMVQTFKNGLVVKYNGTITTPVDNGLYFVVLNRNAGDFVLAATARIWYTDA